MRDSHHSMGLISHVVLAPKRATCEAFDEVFRTHGLPRAEIDLPTAPASNLPAPSTIAEAEASEHAEVDLPTAPPADYQHRQPLPRRRHRNTLIYGVVPGHGSPTAYCRPTLSVQRSSQPVIRLKQNGCSVGNPMNLVGL